MGSLLVEIIGEKMDPITSAAIIAIVTIIVGLILRFALNIDIFPIAASLTILFFFIPIIIAYFNYVNAPTHDVEQMKQFIDYFVEAFVNWFPGVIIADIVFAFASKLLKPFGIDL